MRVVEPLIHSGPLRNPDTGFFAAPALEKPDNPALTQPLYRFTKQSPVYNHPDSGVAFASARWAWVEKDEGVYDWSPIMEKLNEAGARGRTLVLRIAPYALGDDDVPGWLRARNPGVPDFPFWQIDPNTTDYARCWARFVREMAKTLDGHPYLSSVDMAIVGAWGEGGGVEFVGQDKLDLMIGAYLDGFRKTPLEGMLHDHKSVAAIKKHGKPVGFRLDCLGDMGGFHGRRWSHMQDFYPMNIENFGMGRAWEKAPVVFEACWTMRDWFNNGWDVDYIIRESLKWHISSFASKHTPVPHEWKSEVAEWVSKMGYRLELRRIVTPEEAGRETGLRVATLWRNAGVAPCYHPYQMAYRLRDRQGRPYDIPSAADVRAWLPGEDNLVEDNVALRNVPDGTYELSVGILSGIEGFAPLQLGTGTDADGFTPAGPVRVGREA